MFDEDGSKNVDESWMWDHEVLRVEVFFQVEHGVSSELSDNLCHSLDQVVVAQLECNVFLVFLVDHFFDEIFELIKRQRILSIHSVHVYVRVN